MTRNKVLVVTLVLGAIALGDAFNQVVPHDKEIIYNYKAIVKAGTHYPSHFESQFVLHGHLHIHADDNGTFVKLSDLKYNLHNGKVHEKVDKEIKDVELSDHMEDLEKPFKVIHYSDGKVLGILMGKDEKPQVQNIKKSIASIMQLDVDKLHLKDLKHAHSFVTKEHSIYGPQQVHYTAIPHKTHCVKVHKMTKFTSDHHTHVFSNTPLGVCDAPIENVISQESQRKYLINLKEPSQPLVEYMTANGGVYYHPFDGKSDVYYMIVNQTMTLKKAGPKPQDLKEENLHLHKDLTYEFHEEDVINDKSGSSDAHVHTEKLMPVVMHMLEDIHDYLQGNHMEPHIPDQNKEQLVDNLRIRLSYFSLENLQNMHHMLEQSKVKETKDIFYQMLPNVGTKATALYIKYLIENNVVSARHAVGMLQEMPTNLIEPTKDFVSELEPMLSWQEVKVPWQVRKIALMAFGSVIHKSFVHELKMHPLKEHDELNSDAGVQHNVVEKSLKEKISEQLQAHFEKYVKIFMDKLKKSDKYEEQVVYMAALFNMKLPNVAKHMVKMMKEDMWEDHHKKLIAAMTAASGVMRDPEQLFETMWPLLANREEHPEVRVVAYTMIMGSHPTDEMLTNVFWLMHTESNPELYQYHYTYFHAMSKAKTHCKKRVSDQMATLLRYMHPPKFGASFYHHIDFKDAQYGFGGEFNFGMLFTNDSVVSVGIVKSEVFNIASDDYTVLVKLRGLEKIEDLFAINLEHKKPLIDIDSIMKIVKHMKEKKDALVEVMVIKKANVINSVVVTGDNMGQLWSLLDLDTISRTKKDHFDISYTTSARITSPSDLGLPITWNAYVPMVQKNSIRMILDTAGDIFKVNVDSNYVQWTHYKHGLLLYNPIVDVYQGVQKMHSINMALPIFMDLSLNTRQDTMKVSFKEHGDVAKDTMGIKTHSTSYVVVKNLLEVQDIPVALQKSSSHSKHMMEVTDGHQYKSNHTIMEDEDLMFGSHWKIMMFDSDHHISNGTFKNEMYLMMQPYTKHFENPLDYTFTFLGNFFYSLLLQPAPGSLGVLMVAEPMHSKKVTNIDLNVRVDSEEKHEGFVYTPGTKLSARLTYAVKDQEKSLKTWDVSAHFDLNPGHTIEKSKMVLTRTIPGQKDYKVCVEGTKKYTKNVVNGHLNIATSHSSDERCDNPDSVVDITMTGTQSEEQTKIHRNYWSCMHPLPEHMAPYNTMECMADHSSIRKYLYEVKTTKVPSEFKKMVFNWWDEIKGFYADHYNVDENDVVDVKEENLKIETIYPVAGHEIDVNVYTAHHKHSLGAVPDHFYKWFGMVPDNMMYSEMFMLLDNLGLVDHCEVHLHDHEGTELKLNEHQIDHKIPEDWHMYAGDTKGKPKMAVYVKKEEKHMAVKIEDGSHTIEIHVEDPKSGTYKFLLDGKATPQTEEHHFEDWVSYKVFTHHDEMHPVVVTMPYSGLHVTFDGHSVEMMVPKMDPKWVGECFDHV